jgi:hypothetical protein
MSLSIDTTSPYSPAVRCTVADLVGWILPLLRASKRPAILWGAPGVGKSAIPAAWAAAQGLAYSFLSLATSAPEDIGGVPTRDEGRLVRLNLGALRTACEVPTLLHIDEITCATPAGLGAVLSLIQDRRAGDATLHPDTLILLSGNPPSTTSGTTPPPAALANRCAQWWLAPSVADFATFLRPLGHVHAMIADVIEASPGLLEIDPPETALVTGASWASPRAIHAAADEIESLHTSGVDVITDPRVRALLVARLGAKGAAFAGILAAAAKLPKPKAIAADPLNAPVPDPRSDLDAALACVAVLPSVGAIDASAAWVWAARFANEIGVIMAGACKRAAPVPAGGFKGPWAKEATQALTAIGVKEAKAHAGRV